MPESHQSSLLNGSQWVSQLVSQWVTDKYSQWSDSGPTKKTARLVKWNIPNLNITFSRMNWLKTWEGGYINPLYFKLIHQRRCEITLTKREGYLSIYNNQFHLSTKKYYENTTNNFWKLPIGVFSALKSHTEILFASTLKGQYILCQDNKCNVATSNRNAPSLSSKGVLKIPDILPRSSPLVKIMVQDLGKTSWSCQHCK